MQQSVYLRGTNMLKLHADLEHLLQLGVGPLFWPHPLCSIQSRFCCHQILQEFVAAESSLHVTVGSISPSDTINARASRQTHCLHTTLTTPLVLLSHMLSVVLQRAAPVSTTPT